MAEISLQWSHVLTNVETADAVRAWQPTPPASMEPRPHERGNVGIGVATVVCRPELQWSHVLTNVETPPRSRALRKEGRAPMRPRPHERENTSHKTIEHVCAV